MSGNQQEMVELLIEKYKANPTAPATLVRLLPMFSYKLKSNTDQNMTWKGQTVGKSP